MRNHRLLYFLIFCLGFAYCGTVMSQEYVTPSELREWVYFLASDKMRGRKNGSPEMKTAASWIADQLSALGVKPMKKDGSFFQEYSYSAGRKTVNERNVIGLIEGSDSLLNNEFIILSAHYDHIGISGNSPDSINNGADDNAAGIATIIGIAKYIRDSGIKPGRSILFAAFSGEEHGVKGSRYFVNNPLLPLENAYADLNFEMTGHSELLGKNNYYMTGCTFSDLDDIIKEYNEGSGFTLVDTISIARDLFFMSDNISFSKISSKGGISKGIPGGTFATTTMAPYLHTPNDEADLFDFGNMSALVNHFSVTVLRLSYEKRAVAWTNEKWTRP